MIVRQVRQRGTGFPCTRAFLMRRDTARHFRYQLGAELCASRAVCLPSAFYHHIFTSYAQPIIAPVVNKFDLA